MSWPTRLQLIEDRACNRAKSDRLESEVEALLAGAPRPPVAPLTTARRWTPGG